MTLSLVLPMFDAGATALTRVAWLHAWLARHVGACELLVVDDGSTDDTAARLEELRLPGLRVLRQEHNRGKFAALRAGVAATQGDVVAFTDIDVPYDPALLPYAARLVTEQGFHVVTGDRTLPGSNDAHASARRALGSRVYAWLVRMLVTGGLFDTQCGIKVFRGDVARELFGLAREDGFAGDVELLYLALKYNLALRRVPVRWIHHGTSSVRMLRHGPGMILACLRLVWRYRRGRYESAALRAIAAQEYFRTAVDAGEPTSAADARQA